MPVPELHFHEGTLLLKNWTDDHAPPCFEWDNRSGAWRALAIQYSTVCRIFKQSSLVFKDAAARFEKMDIQWKLNYEPYPYQQEAVDAWIQAGMRGSILLPTGSGKTIVALHAIAQ
jgi:predicted helicase